MSKKKVKAVNTGEEIKFENGLQAALFGDVLPGFGEQISQLDTLFKENRWSNISNLRQLLSQIYVEHGLVKTIIDVPVDDGMRGGVEVMSDQLSPDDIKTLQETMKQEGDLTRVGQALKWNRLFGGAGIVVITNQDPKLPFDINLVTADSPLEFRAVDMWELFWTKQNNMDTAAAHKENGPDVEFFDYYGQKIHKSRVLTMKGIAAPSFIRPRLRGWGLSVMETLVRSINQYLKATDLTFEVLDEFKLDIYKIKGLTQTLLSPGGDAKVRNRVSLANSQKNFQNAITMDAEDDYIQKQLSFGGIAEAMTGIRMQVASDMRMPLTKIFGISSQGFNSGEDDIENYNAMVESEVRSKAEYDILKVIKIRCQQLFGYAPDDLSIKFKPLRVLSTEAEESMKTSRYDRLLRTFQAGLCTAKEFKEGVNKDNLLSNQLDVNIEKLEVSPDESSSPKSFGSKSTIDAPEAKS